MIHFDGKDYETDKNDYLLHREDWTPELAIHIATLEGIEKLTADHWEVIEFIQHFYNEYETSPAMRLLVKSIGKALGEKKASSRYLYSLFPKGPAKQASRIAGLPKPAKCL